MRLCTLFLMLLLMLGGCLSARVSPGSTLWVVINNYHEEMTTLESRAELWPDRQRLAESMKMTYLATFGGSKEFNRLVDLDLRRREFLITLRQASLRPERVNEIQQELSAINQHIDTLRPVIKAQMMTTQLGAHEASQKIEKVATLGLLNLAVDEFSAGARNGNTFGSVTQIGDYTVTGRGLFSEVQTPEGQMFRCAIALLAQRGASMKCEPLAPR